MTTTSTAAHADAIALTPAALVELLTTAALMGRDARNVSTRGDMTEALRPYGLSVETPRRLRLAVASAQAAADAQGGPR